MDKRLLDWEARASKAIAEAVLKGSSLATLKSKLEKLEVGGGWEASRLTQSALSEFRKARGGEPCSCEGMERAATRCDMALRRKEGLKDLNRELSEGRSRCGTTVFYLVSWHQSPAEGHKAVQGTLLIDRYWRAVLKNNGLGFYEEAVGKKAEGMLTVQKAQQAPIWLIWRPYCRHRLRAVPIAEALAETDSQIRKNHPEAMDHSPRTKYSGEYYRDRMARKRAMSSAINSAVKAKNKKTAP